MSTPLPAPALDDIEHALRRRLRELRSAEREAAAEYVALLLRGASIDQVRAVGERRRNARDEIEDALVALSEIETRSLP